MGLKRFVLRRLVEIAVIFFVIMTVLFVLFRLAPGDPVSRMVDPSMTPEDARLLMESMGLDQPLWTQYLYYLKNMEIFDIREDENLILIKGAVPGSKNGLVQINKR